MFWISAGHIVSMGGFSFNDEVVFDQLLFEIKCYARYFACNAWYLTTIQISFIKNSGFHQGHVFNQILVFSGGCEKTDRHVVDVYRR